ncbi:hypothetical protein YC2023_073685 [Brassica napus]
MRPVFGGRGFGPFVSSSPTERDPPGLRGWRRMLAICEDEDYNVAMNIETICLNKSKM